LMGLAILLAIVEKNAKFRKDIKDISIVSALFIGLDQTFALIPGSSRSGTTITGGLIVDLNRESVARFSLLLSVPAIIVSDLLQIYEALEFVDSSMAINLIISTLFSGISGYIAIDFLLKYLRKNTTFLFIYYRIALGLIIIILLSAGIISV